MAGPPPYDGPCRCCQRTPGRYIRDNPGIGY
jgi:hypothetical protein